MNIFFLDWNPEKAAIYHCDKHVIKMINESAQILSTAHYVLNRNFYLQNQDSFMKFTHINHPCCKWAQESTENYLWLRELLANLLKEYEYRYEKKGKFEKARKVLEMPPPSIEKREMTTPPSAMPDFCKISDNVVENYRYYYINCKKHFATWKKREKPDWWIENC